MRVDKQEFLVLLDDLERKLDNAADLCYMIIKITEDAGGELERVVGGQLRRYILNYIRDGFDTHIDKVSNFREKIKNGEYDEYFYEDDEREDE